MLEEIYRYFDIIRVKGISKWRGLVNVLTKVGKFLYYAVPIGAIQ